MPASTQALGFIEQEVFQLSQGTVSFTLYDVSRRVQIRLEASHLPKERHTVLRDDVESAVHNTLDQTLWSRTLNVPMPGRIGVSATVYHRVNSNPFDYGKPTANQVASQFTPQASSVSIVSQPATLFANDVYPNKSELRIPKRVVTQMGIKAGDELFVIKESGTNRLRLSKTTQLVNNIPGDVIAVVTSDGRNELRLTRAFMEKNLSGVSYDIEFRDNYIGIRTHG